MRIIEKILGCLAVLCGLVCVLSLLFVFRPDLKETLAERLHLEQNQAAETGVNSDLSEVDPSFAARAGTEGEEQGNEPAESFEEISTAETDTKEESGGIGASITSEYIPPEQDRIEVPEQVSGRNGYQQIQEQQEQIDEETARQLQDQLDYGYTGDGLEFDAAYYPYYAMLDDKGKHVYRQMYANAAEAYSAFAPVESIIAGELKNIFYAVVNDHPELFWLETAYTGKYTGNGQCVEIDLQFNRTAQNLESAKSAFDESANQILAGAQNLSSNYEKERFVHDALIDRVSYNLGAEMNQSAYSALVNGQSVCAGYARAFQYLLQQLGIPCYYCTGYAGESHAWNIVGLDDGYYNVDVTWDDTGKGTYDYFNKTDADYASSHVRQELSVYLPPCNGQAYRDLEQNRNLRSLADAGMTEERVFTDMQGYFDDCYQQIVQNGTGSYTFYNVIEGENLLDEWQQNYQYDRYRQAYMEPAMAAIGAHSCEMSLETEELRDGRYLIAHTVSVR